MIRKTFGEVILNCHAVSGAVPLDEVDADGEEPSTIWDSLTLMARKGLGGGRTP